MGRSRIPYLDDVWNVTTGCTPVSAGCDNCWARSMLRRFGSCSEPMTHPDRLDAPLRWRKPRVVGVSFLGDLLHPQVSDNFIGHVLNVMDRARRHTFLVLTKRPRRLLDVLADRADHGSTGLRDCPNVWIGVSVEDQETADERIAGLLAIPAAHHFLSVEPQIGPVSLQRWIPERGCFLEWVVCGCESGPSHRPFKREWARLLRDQCAGARVPFFYKQEPAAAPVGAMIHRPKIDGEEYREMPWTLRKGVAR